jgi:hypothetical protein
VLVLLGIGFSRLASGAKAECKRSDLPKLNAKQDDPHRHLSCCLDGLTPVLPVLGTVGLHRAPFVSAANEMGAYVGPISQVVGA